MQQQAKRMKVTRPPAVDLRTIAAQSQQWTPVKQGGDDYQNMACVMHSSLYVLELEDGCYYVGLATAGCGVEQRISMTSPRHDWPRKFNADGASSIQPDQIAQRSP